MNYLRVLRTTEVTLTHTFYVDGQPADPSAVAVTVRRVADGTTVQNGPATDAAGTGVWTFALQERSELDVLEVEWVGTALAGANVTVLDYVEIVGGFMFSIQDIRDAHKDLVSATTYPAEKLQDARLMAEAEADTLTGEVQVPRFAVAVLDGSGDTDLILDDFRPTKIRAVSYGNPGATRTAFSAAEVAAIALDPAGILIRTDGTYWPVGYQNIWIEYEHGRKFPHPSVRTGALRRTRYWATQTRSGVPETAVQFQVGGIDGTLFRLAVPTEDSTGDPIVDAIYRRYGRGEKVWIA